VIGRFAPSPTGELHVGNLRTALVAWLSARSQGGSFVIRMEDLDRMTSSAAHERSQLDALRWMGIDWDGPVVRQSERSARYDAALGQLRSQDLTYPCFCSRRQIAEAVAAPHGGSERPYPGSCRPAGATPVVDRESSGRRPATRLLAPMSSGRFFDGLHGDYEGWIDDVVLCRNDGVAAYNLAVVVDDGAQGVTEVVRGDDLLASTPRQLLIGSLLDISPPSYLHVPLVIGTDGQRLAKRHGAVTVTELARRGVTAGQLTGLLAYSLGLLDRFSPAAASDLIADFDVARLRPQPWTFSGCD
jgi:glutamyl-tRNA synthetase